MARMKTLTCQNRACRHPFEVDAEAVPAPVGEDLNVSIPPQLEVECPKCSAPNFYMNLPRS